MMPKLPNVATAAIVLTLLAALAAFAVRLFREPPGREVRPEDLAELIDRADRVVVRVEPYEPLPALYESSDRRDLDALKAALRVERPQEPRVCACVGTPAVFLYVGGE